MKNATVADLRNNFSLISKQLREGEAITITKRGQPFALLSPVGSRKRPRTINRLKRLKSMFPDGPVESNTLQTMDYDRGDR